MTVKDWVNKYPTDLASGQSKRHIPFTHLVNNLHTYIHRKYLPPGILFRDPRNMTKPDILAFFDHVRSRQETHGVAEAFSFKVYHNGTDIVLADYGLRVEEEKAADRALKQTRGRQTQKRSKTNKAKTSGRIRPTAIVTEDPLVMDPSLGDADLLLPVIDHGTTLSQNVPKNASREATPSTPVGRQNADPDDADDADDADGTMLSPSVPQTSSRAATPSTPVGRQNADPDDPDDADNADGTTLSQNVPKNASRKATPSTPVGRQNADPDDADGADNVDGTTLLLDVPKNARRMRLRSQKPDAPHAESSSRRTLRSHNPEPQHAEGISSRTLRSHGEKKGHSKRGGNIRYNT
jgi:hypothetical protein